MHAFVSAAALSLAISALAIPTGPVPIIKLAGKAEPHSYIIKLKDVVSRDVHLQSVRSTLSNDSNVKYEYEMFHGYAVTLKGQDLDQVRRSNDVEFIEEDAIITLDYIPGDNVETNEEAEEQEEYEEPAFHIAHSGLSQHVDIYSLDTGVYTRHAAFGGRAYWGATFGGYRDYDGNGHGTHTAGIAAGKGIGIAEHATIIGIKVLSNQGAGLSSDVIAGINWAYQTYRFRQRPSVINMSLGGGGMSTFVDRAVRRLTEGGMHVTVAAGNDNNDVSNHSPGRLQSVVTVGAVDDYHHKARFSSYGRSIDVQAPGVQIRSAWINSPYSLFTASGTSMAAPYVAGVLAAAISKHGNKSPAALMSDLKAHAKPVCTGEPYGTSRLLATAW